MNHWIPKVLHTLVIDREYFAIEGGQIVPIIWKATEQQIDLLREGNLFTHYNAAHVELMQNRPMQNMLLEVGVTMGRAQAC